MRNFLLNNWVIGIAGGLISALLYSLFSFIFRKISKSKDIERANNEILNTLKPYVIDRGLPEVEIIEALIDATARKYQISYEQMYSIPILCDELIKEITESIYITYEKKNEYNISLAKYKKDLEIEDRVYFLEAFAKGSTRLRFFSGMAISLSTTMTLLLMLKGDLVDKFQEKILIGFIMLLLLALLLLVLLKEILKGDKND